MAIGTGWLVFIGLVAAYVTFVYWLVSTKRLEKWNLSLMLGFVLMIRTQRGRKLLDLLARPKRFWNGLADVGTVLTFVGMAGMTVLFATSLVLALTPKSGVPVLGAREILVIPGFNPFVPLWYGLVALIVTLVVHEGGHGVLARANGLKVKSLGLLYAIVPVGAFVEPEESELMATSRRRRLRVFSAGPATNFAVGALFLVLFAALFGSADLRPGAHVISVTEGGPAQRAGIGPLATIASVDGVAVGSWGDFQQQMRGRHPDEVVSVGLDDGSIYNVKLTSRWGALSQAEQDRYIAANRTLADELQTQGIMGVNGYLPDFHEPRPFDGLVGLLTVIQLPLAEVIGKQPVLTKYLPAFYDTPFHGATFWILLSLLFWVFWMNLAVGTTNVLPMLPLDGGHIFRDGVGGILAKLRPRADPAVREATVRRIANIVSVAILVAFLLTIIVPRYLQ